jgi:hypothetical protein
VARERWKPTPKPPLTEEQIEAVRWQVARLLAKGAILYARRMASEAAEAAEKDAAASAADRKESA